MSYRVYYLNPTPWDPRPQPLAPRPWTLDSTPREGYPYSVPVLTVAHLHNRDGLCEGGPVQGAPLGSGRHRRQHPAVLRCAEGVLRAQTQQQLPEGGQLRRGHVKPGRKVQRSPVSRILVDQDILSSGKFWASGLELEAWICFVECLQRVGTLYAGEGVFFGMESSKNEVIEIISRLYHLL